MVKFLIYLNAKTCYRFLIFFGSYGFKGLSTNTQGTQGTLSPNIQTGEPNIQENINFTLRIGTGDSFHEIKSLVHSDKILKIETFNDKILFHLGNKREKLSSDLENETTFEKSRKSCAFEVGSTSYTLVIQMFPNEYRESGSPGSTPNADGTTLSNNSSGSDDIREKDSHADPSVEDSDYIGDGDSLEIFNPIPSYATKKH